MLVFRQADQAPADQRAQFEIEGCTSFQCAETIKFHLHIAVLAKIMLNQQEPALFGEGDPLHGLLVDENKSRAQSLVPGHHAVQSPTKGHEIQLALQPETEDDVIGFAAPHLSQKHSRCCANDNDRFIDSITKEY